MNGPTLPAPIAVALVAVAWCALHSLLIAPPVERRLRRWLGRRAAWYRLLYNLVSLATLLAAWAFFRAHPGRPLWRWHGAWQAVRAAGWLYFLVIGWAGSRAHDGAAFVGVRQIRQGNDAATGDAFTRAGILGRMRHPWYAAGLVFLVVYRDVTTTDLVWRGVFFLYLLVGARLEERKLRRRFGEAYAAYCREVPAFFPRLRPARGAGDR